MRQIANMEDQKASWNLILKTAQFKKEIIKFVAQSCKLKKTSKIFPPKNMNKIIIFQMG